MTIPHTNIGWRMFLLASGASLFIWLMLEDTQLLPLLMLCLLAAVLFLLNPVLRRFAGIKTSPILFLASATMLGGLIGSGTALLAALMMFLKTAWHSHIFPDYPVPMMIAMLERLPIWAIVGLALGASFGLFSHAIYYGVSVARA